LLLSQLQTLLIQLHLQKKNAMALLKLAKTIVLGLVALALVQPKLIMLLVHGYYCHKAYAIKLLVAA
jgi:hypothetical protein